MKKFLAVLGVQSEGSIKRLPIRSMPVEGGKAEFVFTKRVGAVTHVGVLLPQQYVLWMKMGEGAVVPVVGDVLMCSLPIERGRA
jgi:hypothetical protein